jgi:hypothetical protein
MLMVSAYLNAMFLARLGKTPLDQYVYGAAGVAIDVFMALCPFFYLSAFKNREFLRGGFALLLWVALTAFSAQSAIGHLASSRGDAASNRAVAADTYKDAREELKKLKERRDWLPRPSESAESLRAKIKGLQATPVWTQTAECANQWNTTAKQFCAKITELTSALNNTLEFDKIQAQIDKLQSKAEEVASHNSGVASDADAGAGTISKLLGLSVKDTQSLLNLLGAMVLLLGAGLGPFVSLSVVAKIDAKTAKKSDETPIIDATFTPVQPEPQGLLLTTESGKPIDFQVRQAAQLVAPGKDLTQDAKELLLAIGMPTRPCDVREKDDRSVLAWRFAAWLAAHGHTGEFSAEQVDSLYDRFTREDCRHPWAMRVVKAELQQLKPAVASTSSQRQDDGSRATVWTIRPPSVLRLTDILRRKGIANASPPPAPVAPPPSEPPALPEAQEPNRNVLRFFAKKAAGE